MNPFHKPVLKIMAALVLGAAASAVSAADTAASTDVTALQAVTQSWFQAYNAGDADAVTALFADDATLMPPDATAVSGKDAIHNFFVVSIGVSQHEGSTINLTGTPQGGVAGDWGWLSATDTVKDKTGQVVDTGKFLVVFKKVDGKWVFFRDLWSSDKPKQ